MADGEVDDHSSMVRFLMYALYSDVQAIIENQYHTSAPAQSFSTQVGA
jgi:hypothetical protein